jgi:hypothetical protein
MLPTDVRAQYRALLFSAYRLQCPPTAGDAKSSEKKNTKTCRFDPLLYVGALTASMFNERVPASIIKSLISNGDKRIVREQSGNVLVSQALLLQQRRQPPPSAATILQHVYCNRASKERASSAKVKEAPASRRANEIELYRL